MQNSHFDTFHTEVPVFTTTLSWGIIIGSTALPPMSHFIMSQHAQLSRGCRVKLSCILRAGCQKLDLVGYHEGVPTKPQQRMEIVTCPFLPPHFWSYVWPSCFSGSLSKTSQARWKRCTRRGSNIVRANSWFQTEALSFGNVYFWVIGRNMKNLKTESLVANQVRNIWKSLFSWIAAWNVFKSEGGTWTKYVNKIRTSAAKQGVPSATATSKHGEKLHTTTPGLPGS